MQLKGSCDPEVKLLLELLLLAVILYLKPLHITQPDQLAEFTISVASPKGNGCFPRVQVNAVTLNLFCAEVLENVVKPEPDGFVKVLGCSLYDWASQLNQYLDSFFCIHCALPRGSPFLGELFQN